MLRSSSEDYLMRMIRELARVIARAAGFRDAGQMDMAAQALRDAEGELLGPLGQVAPLVDSATAAHMIGEPRRIAAWARLLHERADLMRRAGDPAAEVTARRAADLGAEALARAEGIESEIREMLGPLVS